MISDLVALVGALNPFPIVQMSVGAVILFAGIWLMLRAERDKGRADAPHPTVSAPLPDGVGLFFNGPLIVALESLRENGATLKRIEEQVREIRLADRHREVEALERRISGRTGRIE